MKHEKAKRKKVKDYVFMWVRDRYIKSMYHVYMLKDKKRVLTTTLDKPLDSISMKQFIQKHEHTF